MDEVDPWTTPAAAAAGWRLEISPDGASATLHGPGNTAVTAMTPRTVTVRLITEPAEGPAVAEDADALQPLEWTVELAERILRRAQPTASTFLRALIAQGGTATAEHLRDTTGLQLHHARQSLTTSVIAVLRGHPLGRSYRHVVQGRTHPDNPRGTGRVYDYHLPEHLVPIFDEALRNIDR